MAKMDFPASPTEGQQFTPVGGPVYIYTEGAWKFFAGSGGGASITVSDTAPVGPQAGALWWESDSGILYLYYNDGNSSQWVQLAGPMPLDAADYVMKTGAQAMQGPLTVGGYSTTKLRNRIVNGAMQISQEWGNTAITSSSSYVADQWLFSFSTAGAAFSYQRVQVVTPNGSQNRMRVTVTTAKASLVAADVSHITQIIEGTRIADFRWGTASARQVILRMGVKAPAGTYSIRLMNGATNRSYVANFTISAAQANTDTTQTFVIPGDTTGTWAVDNTAAMYVSLCFAEGSNYVGVAGWQAGIMLATASNTNGLATVNNTFELFDVGLYLDDGSGVPPPWEMPDEAQELAACQRYWQTSGSHLCNGYHAASGVVYDAVPLPVVMRAAPTMTLSSVSYANGSGLIVNQTYPMLSRTQFIITVTGYGYAAYNRLLNARM